MSDSQQDMLIAMGFTRQQADEALTVCQGNLESAANYLLSSPPDTAATGSSGNNASNNNSSGSTLPSFRLVQGPISQYTVENGRSACTCMALAASLDFLKQDSKSVDSAFLQRCVTRGATVYQDVVTAGGTEHTSAEEVLTRTSAFNGLKQREIRQGLLSRNRNEGLAEVLRSLQSNEEWICCLVTKPPETVLICIPPKDSSGDFILIDTHPRPPETDQAYAKIYSSPDDLWASLEELFPILQLDGSDPIMASMYNAFDAYAFGKK